MVRGLSVPWNDFLGKILVAGGRVIEVTGFEDEYMAGKAYLDDRNFDNDDHNVFYEDLIDYGFMLFTKEEAAEVFKPFFDLKKEKVAV